MAALLLSSEPPRFRSCSASNTATGSWAMPASDYPSLRPSRTNPDLSDCGAAFPLGNSEAWKDLDNIAALGLSLHAEGDDESPASNTDIPQINFRDDWHLYEETKLPLCSQALPPMDQNSPTASPPAQDPEIGGW
ncbi:Dbl homology domain-containing protein [Apiospora phragmitis]|uniref:Dbl homology domain-containing protein n=1 Tax=Apiospora phragmitis TaxID=2905665 RepID=A0ABR1TQI4_9PEZI